MNPVDPISLVYHPATEQDLEEVYTLYMNESANRFLTYDPMTLDVFRPLYLNLLSTQTLFVTELQSKIIGSYRLIRKEYRQSDTVYIGGFVVHASYTGMGIGKMMMQHIIREASRMGIKRLELTVDLDNEPAITLYKKTGFEIEGRIRKSYKLSTTKEYYDEYLMSNILD